VVWRLSAILFWLFLSPTLHAENHLPGARPVEWLENGGKQKQGFASTLVVAPLSDLHTEVIYSKQGIAFDGMKGFVVMYPGTSAAITSDFGLMRSMGPLANLLVREGYGVMAFRQPIYYMAEQPELREPYLQKYGNLDGNLEWYLKTLQYVQSKIPPGTPLHSVGRSTGTGVQLEALHRYSRGDSGFELMGKFKTMLLMSVDGHTPESIATWHEAEVKEFIVEKPETGDKPVVMACPKIFSDMNWQTQLVRESEMAGRPMPEIYLTAGSRDEFTKPSVSLGPIHDFVKNHPGLFVGLLFHDGFHNPNRPIPGVEGAGTMSRTQMLVSWPLYPKATPYSPGFDVAYLPSRGHVWSPLDASEQAVCKRILRSAGAYVPD